MTPKQVAALVGMVVLVTACAELDPIRGDSCPETVRDGGLVEGIELDAPDWLPAGFPMPAGITIHHINDLGDNRNYLAGFVRGGDAGAVLAAFPTDLADAGYETLLAAEGFVPIANDALVVINEPLEVAVTVGVLEDVSPVRVSDDECPLMPGVLVFLRFEPIDVDAARRLYAGSSLTQGDAQATIGDQSFSESGECLIHAGRYTFGSTSGDGIGIDFEESESGVVGSASVNSARGDVVLNLDLAELSETAPEFRVTESGFSVEGMFFDGVGDLGLVGGRVAVECG